MQNYNECMNSIITAESTSLTYFEINSWDYSNDWSCDCSGGQEEYNVAMCNQQLILLQSRAYHHTQIIDVLSLQKHKKIQATKNKFKKINNTHTHTTMH